MADKQTVQEIIDYLLENADLIRRVARNYNDPIAVSAANIQALSYESAVRLIKDKYGIE